MTLQIAFQAEPGRTFSATLERLSDGAFWDNQTDLAFESSPAFADRVIALTEGTAENAGSYAGANSGDLGDAGRVRIRVHDAAQSDRVVGLAEAEVIGGREVVAADHQADLGSIPSAAEIATAVWNTSQAAFTSPGTFGFFLDAAVSQVGVGGSGGGSGGGAGTGSTGDYLADLIAARDNVALQLADITAHPKPSYSIDGQSVDWDTHVGVLSEKLETLNRAIQAAEPFEIHTTGLTG